MVLKLITYSAILGYLAMSYCFFSQWLEFFLKDEDINYMKPRFFSSVILVIATIFWPIVVPFAYLELLKFQKKHKDIIDLLINMSNPKMSDD